MTDYLSGRDHKKIEAELLERTAELARTNEELRRNVEKYRELVQNANSIILRMDVKGNITFFNEFAQNFFGYKEEEILGEHLSSLGKFFSAVLILKFIALCIYAMFTTGHSIRI